MKPVIGILSIATLTPSGIPAMQTGVDYLGSILRAQGVPLQLPCVAMVDEGTIAQWLSLCDGIILPGGGDVAPKFYGQDPCPSLTRTNRVQDEIELTLARLARQKGMPVLGICRGHQSLNVAFGGTLWQDIPSQCRDAICHSQAMDIREELFHELCLKKGSVLADIMGDTYQESNTFHHQAVCDVADGFTAVAHTKDGMIEAIEHKDGNMIGVQWHPEHLAAQHSEHAALFEWIVQKATQYHAKSSTV